VLNVATGGTLIQHIPSEVAGGLDHDPRRERRVRAHEVGSATAPGIREILGRETILVNSFHQQAVGQLGQGLFVSARTSDDSILAGIEAPGRRFVPGVQWHPEAFREHRDGFQALFEALVRTASGA
jgi:putative glutamine amidotransferase